MKTLPITLRIKGNFACFTRPEFHVERVSYPVITPEAARGIFDAILMKPVEKPEQEKRHNKIGFRWRVTRIGVVNKGVFFSILRNELGYGTHQEPAKAFGYNIHDKRVHAQRNSLILTGGADEDGERRPLEYLIEAVIEVAIDKRADRNSGGVFLAQKYREMFLRRARKGQCFYQPFLGCREFSVSEWSLEENPPEKIDGQPAWESFGMIFRRFDFSSVWKHWGVDAKTQRGIPRPQGGWGKKENRPAPLFFDAVAKDGWIDVPENGKEVFRDC